MFFGKIKMKTILKLMNLINTDFVYNKQTLLLIIIMILLRTKYFIWPIAQIRMTFMEERLKIFVDHYFLMFQMHLLQIMRLEILLYMNMIY